METKTLLLALGANFFFAFGSQFFTYFSRKLGSVWMNAFKASIAFICFTTWLVVNSQMRWIGVEMSYPLIISGFIGLGVGDVLLLLSFKEMGAGKTLMLFAFQPIIMGLAGYFLFDQQLDSERLWAIIFFVLCLVIFSIESFKDHGHWGTRGLIFAVLGILLDATGVIVTRYMFDGDQSLSPLLVNFYRTFGALVFFGLYQFFKPIHLVQKFKSLSTADRSGAILGAFLGTFVSLSLFLAALQYAHLASLSGIAITGAIFSSILECLWQRKRPSKYLLLAFLFFLFGMWILLF